MKTAEKIAFFAVILLMASVARAQIFVDHESSHGGGSASDSDFINDSGVERWQYAADDFSISLPATIRQINWWGFYGGDFSPPQSPPPSETMRIRFYSARPSDGLPDVNNILSEQTLANPSRTATGFNISSNHSPEYDYQATLPTPVDLAADTQYWLEVAQIGDVNSLFRWEIATGPGSHALNNIATSGDWALPADNGDLAFQLSNLPEPSAAGLLLLGSYRMRRKRRVYR